MKDLKNEAFIYLFGEAFAKCFGFALTKPLSETESRHFSNRIMEATGLVIGAKSIKNYSLYVFSSPEAKPENPSVATLDTLARYVLHAPYTTETDRKNKESHYPYWFQYRQTFTSETGDNGNITSIKIAEPAGINKKKKNTIIILVIIAALAITALVISYLKSAGNREHFTDNFSTVQQDSLRARGWFIQSEDRAWWQRRAELANHLTLFTLPGDNWADSANTPRIKNILFRKISSDCFTAEVRLDNFVPTREWQQAGVLLMEDTNFYAKSLRLSIAFNDLFGGYARPAEIIVQAISSGGDNAVKPEEILHLPLFNLEAGKEALVKNNLQKSALRIEKTGNHFRFLYAAGSAENSAFKEALSKDLPVQPKYIGLFALQGFVKNPVYLPARFKFFSIKEEVCR